MISVFTSKVVIEKVLHQKYFFNRMSKLTSRCCIKTENHSRLLYQKSLYNTRNKEEFVRTSNEEDFVMIYRFPHITKARFLCRLKLYQTVTTLCLLPVHGYFYWTGHILATSMTFTVGVCILSTAMLYVMGEFFRKFIGAIYYSEQRNVIRISHLSFFGKRKEVFLPLKDLVPLSELDDNVSDVYIKIKRYSTENFNLLLSLKFGGIEDKQYFTTVFGSIKK